MIFSHIPAGYLTTKLTQKWWQKGLTKKQSVWILIIGTLSGTLPDIDVFYHYLVDASVSHRELITHSLIPYIAILIGLYLIGMIFQNMFMKVSGIVIFISSLGHLILDSTTAGIPWLYPFSVKLYGLLMIEKLSAGFYGQNLYVFTLTIELTIFIITALILFWQHLKKRLYKIIAITFSLLPIIIFAFSVYKTNEKMYHYDSIAYFGDMDNDGEINKVDSDMDGDGTLNILDKDANNNGISNKNEVIHYAKSMENTWYDFTEEGYWGFLSRFGFLSNSDIVLKSFDMTGIYLGEEMAKSFENFNSEYTNDPRDAAFQSTIANLYAYCQINDLLIDPGERSEVGDLIFYKNGGINYVAMVVEQSDNVNYVMYGKKGNKYITKEDINIIKDELGELVAIGRILP